MIHRTIALTLLTPLLLGAQKFYDDDPLDKLPAPMHVEDAKSRKLNDFYDLYQNTFGQPGERHSKKKRSPELIPSQAVNTLDEVPDDPAWFINRIGAHKMSVEDLVRGPGNDKSPSLDGPWTIVGAKTSGVTPGFRIKDAAGRMYLLKFDPPTNPEMATASDVIGAKFFHALGYNTPENYIVSFDENRLVLGDLVRVFDAAAGRDRAMRPRDVTLMLAKVPRDRQGRIRGVASRFLSGKFLGEFRYHGTRSDDVNDIVPHEHRRDLRGLFVFAAWLNHNDSRAINNMDLLVDEGDAKFIKHYLIDFGAMFGSASVTSNTARDGNAYFWEFKPALAQLVTLGLYTPRWMRDKYIKHPALGMIEQGSFEPEEWKPNYPNPAFQNRLPDDEFWAAKKVMAFTDEAIRALVGEAKFSDPEATRLLTEHLITRRDRIGETYFAKVLPLDNFLIEDGRITFEDLQIKYGLVDKRDYKVQWSRFSNDSEEHAPIDGVTGMALPAPTRSAAAGASFAAKITGEDEAKTVTVYVRKRASEFQVVGVDRTW